MPCDLETEVKVNGTPWDERPLLMRYDYKLNFNFNQTVLYREYWPLSLSIGLTLGQVNFDLWVRAQRSQQPSFVALKSY